MFFVLCFTPRRNSLGKVFKISPEPPATITYLETHQLSHKRRQPIKFPSCSSETDPNSASFCLSDIACVLETIFKDARSCEYCCINRSLLPVLQGVGEAHALHSSD